MNCLIVDDEVLAQNVLALYISRLDFLTLTGRCNNALQAFAVLNREQVDIMFLDIKMPEMNGLDLIKSLKHPPRVILTTAYDEYALDGYELDVVDYLLKPVRFERFLKAVNKAQQLAHHSPAFLAPKATGKIFYVRSERKLVRIDSQEVRYIESLKNYLAIHAGPQKIIVHATLSNIEEELKPDPHFIQIHKSFIINVQFVAEVGNTMLRLKDNTELPIGNSYREGLLQAIYVFNPR